MCSSASELQTDMEKDKSQYILDVVKKRFYESGIHKVTIDDIAMECGISKKTLYRLFESRAELVEATFKRELGFFEIGLKNVQNTSENAFVGISSFFDFLDSMILPPLVNRDLKERYPDIWHFLVKEGGQLVEDFIIINIQQGISEKFYKNSEGLKTHLRAITKLMQMSFLEGKSVTENKEFEFLRLLLVNYLTTGQVLKVPSKTGDVFSEIRD